MEPITIIFSVARSLKSIAAYLGVIESVEADVAKLRHRDFNSAIENLRIAQSCQSLDQAAKYIETARVRFTDSISLEENENKVDTFVGLAMCQYLQGDNNLAKMTLGRISLEVNLSRSEKFKYIAFDIGVATYVPKSLREVLIGRTYLLPYHLVRAIRNPEKYPYYSNRLRNLETKKEQAIEAIKVFE